MKHRILAALEVLLGFCLAVFLFRWAQGLTLAGESGGLFAGRPVAGYAALLVFAGGVSLLRVCRPLRLPSAAHWKHQLGAAWAGFFPVFVLSVALNWLNWREWGWALLLTAAQFGLIYWFARTAQKIPPGPATAAGALVLLPLGASFLDRFTGALTSVAYAYLLVALAEELLFRGFIQGRLNQAFGRPFSFLGIRWGWGLPAAALLFGLWHFAASFDPAAWPQVLWTAAAGLLFGLVREKSGGVVAPALLHGVMNYGPQALLLALFW